MNKWIQSHRSFFKAVLSHLDTPVSLTTWLLIENREWDQLATRWVDPQHYPEGIFNALRFRKDTLAVDLLRKAPLPTTIDRRSEALAAWERAETQCYHTNELMLRLLSCRVSPEERRFADFLSGVQKRLKRWLGPLPDELLGAFGPGTCVEYKGGNPTVVDKIWLTPTTTPAAAHLFGVFYGRTLWGHERTRAGLPFQATSRGNRLTTVPKDGKTDRPICIEPLGNLWLQLGLGRHLKKRLGLCGLPKFLGTSREIFPGLSVVEPDPQEIHRRLVAGDLRGRFSTIDLSSASDTIALELVRAVVPPDWFDVFDDCRSHMTLVDTSGVKRWRLLEKFSSMGNGFTFELETFIFLALVCEAFNLIPGVDCWVFGDDIIVPEKHARSCMNLLTRCGFTPNLRKSYVSGPFRESCGAYCHSGLDTKPVRISDVPDSVPALMALHNSLFSWGIPFSALRQLREAIPLRFRVYGPNQAGDIVLHGGKWKPAVRRGFSGITWVRGVSLEPQDAIPLDRWSPELAMSAILLGVPPRLHRRGARVTPVHCWTSVS